jgi:hypothetical protein
LINTIPTTDDHQLRRNAHPTYPSETIDHRFDLHLIQTNIHHQMDHPTPPPLSATFVDASATIHATFPTLRNLHRTLVPPTHNHPTMKTLPLAINNVHTLQLRNSQPQSDYHHQAFKVSSFDHLDDNHSNTPWPNPSLPQMTINPPLLDCDYLPTANHAPPNSGATEYFPDDPQSPYQGFGPPFLSNWLPDSGTTSHYTPLFSQKVI